MAKVKKRGEMFYSNFSHPDGTGKKVVKVMDANRQVAQKMADALEEQMCAQFSPVSAQAAAAGKMTFAAFEIAVLAYYKQNRARGTYNITRRSLRKLREAYPISQVSEITPKLVAGLRSRWIAEGRIKAADASRGGPGVVGAEREIRQLMTIMRWAEIQYDMPMQNWRGAKTDRWNDRSKGKLQHTKEEHVAIQAALRDPIEESLYKVGYNLGLRRSEMRHLWRKDIDFKNRLVLIRRKEWTDPATGERAAWEPKGANHSHDMTRSVPMNQEVTEYLRARLEAVPGEWVFSETLLPAQQADNFSHIWADVLERAGVEGTLHTLRHSYISDLLAGGEDIYRVQKFAGHRNIHTTERYAHFIPKVSVAGDSLHRMERGPMMAMGVVA